MLRWLIGIILSEIICKSSNWQHIQRLKITILGANWQLFRLERIAKCSYFILSTQNIKFYWFVMKIKKFLLPIWWYNRGLFPLGNKYFGVFVLNGLNDFWPVCIHMHDIINHGERERKKKRDSAQWQIRVMHNKRIRIISICWHEFNWLIPVLKQS